MSKTILITGASGFIGKALTSELINSGYTIHHLSRSEVLYPSKEVKTFMWDVHKNQIDPECINGVNAIIHLVGEAIFDKRWTPEQKHALEESRTKSIQLIYSLLKQNKNHTIETVVSASAVGYYGSRSNELLTEEHSPSNRFLGKLCTAWEEAVNEGKKLGLRTVQLRTGFVLAKHGGALSPMIKLANWGVLSPLGNGSQWVSWIHLADVIRMYIFACENKNIKGPYNMTAPHPIRNSELTHELAQTLHKPYWLPNVPKWLLKLFLGQRACLILDSTKTNADKILATGFIFKFPTLDAAMRNIFK